MRGKSKANVGDISSALGGGGHRFSAGCTLNMPMQAAVMHMKEVTEAALMGTES